MPTISGTVKDASGNFAAKYVYAYRRATMAFAGAGVSSATTGAYAITVPTNDEHFVVAFDTTDGDPYWDKVLLAGRFNGVNGGAVYFEKAPSDFKTVGSTSISTAQSKFGGSSLYTPVGAGYGTVFSSASDVQLGSGDFTIECYFYGDFSGLGSGTYASLVSRYYTASNSRSYELNVGNIDGAIKPSLLLSTTGSSVSLTLNSSTVVSPNTWYHLAAVRSGTSVMLLLDGALVASGTLSGSLYSAPGASLGLANRFDSNGATTSSPAACYLDDVRITKGVARYSGSFTPSAMTTGVSGGTENAVILDRVVPV